MIVLTKFQTNLRMHIKISRCSLKLGNKIGPQHEWHIKLIKHVINSNYTHNNVYWYILLKNTSIIFKGILQEKFLKVTNLELLLLAASNESSDKIYHNMYKKLNSHLLVMQIAMNILWEHFNIPSYINLVAPISWYPSRKRILSCACYSSWLCGKLPVLWVYLKLGCF